MSKNLSCLFATTLLFSIVNCEEVTKTGTYKYLFFPEECFDKFFTQFQFIDIPCLSQTASRILGLAIVGFSLIVKVPQILKIVINGSVAGLSFSSMLNESIMYSFNIAYNIDKGQDFFLYGENIFILVQNLLIMVLFKKYDKTISMGQLVQKLLFLTVVTLIMVSGYVPPIVFTFSIYINMLLILGSRLPQIQLNYAMQSTGQLAWVTQGLFMGGSLSRAFTIFVSANDPLYNAQNILAFALNFILVAQIALYRRVKKD